MRLRFSLLKYMALSPAHYLYHRDHERPQSDTMRFGSLVHALVLGGDYVVFPGARRQGKEWETFERAHRGRLIVKNNEYEAAQACADSILSFEPARRYLDGEREKLIEWEHETGRPCRSTLDVLGDGFICDLKTTTSAHPAVFAYHARRMLYHAQLSWYGEAAGLRDREYIIIAAEVKPPYVCTVHKLTARAIEMGQRSTRLWLERLAACEAADCWPGYNEAVNELDVDAGLAEGWDDEED